MAATLHPPSATRGATLRDRPFRLSLERYHSWIANLPLGRVEVHGDPTGPTNPSFDPVVHVDTAEDKVPVVLDSREVGRLRVRDILT